MKRNLLVQSLVLLFFMSSCHTKNSENQEIKSISENQDRKQKVERQNIEALIFKNGVGFKSDSDKPFNGEVFKLNRKAEIELEGQYINGKRGGIFKHYIHGVPIEITSYIEGQKNGESRKFESRTYKNFGDLISIENYKMNELDGKQVYYNNNKRLIESEYSKGSFTSSQLFDDNEKLKTLIYRLSDNEYLIREYLLDGKIKREKKFIESENYEPHLSITDDMQTGKTIYSISGNIFLN